MSNINLIIEEKAASIGKFMVVRLLPRPFNTPGEHQNTFVGHELFGESGLYILEGSIASDGNIYHPKQISQDGSLCEFIIEANSTIYIFGGEPFGEERFIDWNFVATCRELINNAKQKWIAGEFEIIKGDEEEFVPYPELHRK